MTTPYEDQPLTPQGPTTDYRGSPVPPNEPAYGAAPPGYDAVPSVPAAAPPYAPDTGSHQPARGFDEKGHVKRGRISALWITLILAAVGLILLIVFIAQNSQVVPVHYLGLSVHLGIGLTVLIAAVVGLLLAAIPGTIRIIQLRKALKTNTPKNQRGA